MCRFSVSIFIHYKDAEIFHQTVCTGVMKVTRCRTQLRSCSTVNLEWMHTLGMWCEHGEHASAAPQCSTITDT